MTTVRQPLAGAGGLLRRLRRPRDRSDTASAVIPVDPVRRALSTGLALISVSLLVLVVDLVGFSQLQHLTVQNHLYSQLRLDLAQGSVPIGPADPVTGAATAPGTPVAVMSAPEIGIGHEVIVEGTGPAQTMTGIGHRRDTVMPCQTGSAVLYGRSGAYGAIGHAWAKLQNGDRFTITMGQGHCTYQVLDQRVAGQKAPVPPSGATGALTLVTATGHPFAPTGVLRVDTTLVTKAFPTTGTVFPAGALPAAEEPLGTDTTQLFPLTELLEGLAVLALVTGWLRRRWDRTKTWIVVTPVAFLLAFLTANSVALLLPNLL